MSSGPSPRGRARLWNRGPIRLVATLAVLSTAACASSLRNAGDGDCVVIGVRGEPVPGDCREQVDEHPTALPPPSDALRDACAYAEWPYDLELPRYWPPQALHPSPAQYERALHPAPLTDSQARAAAWGSASEKWYASQLCAMGEAPLSAPTPGGARARLLWLRSFHPGIAVRLEQDGERATLLSIEMSGPSGYQAGRVARRLETEITAAQLARFETLLEESGFWRSERVWPILGDDGAQWILEVSEPDRYHIVDRWGPLSAALYLIEISGLDPRPIY